MGLAQSRRLTSNSDALLKQLDASIARLERIGQELHTPLAATTGAARQNERAADLAKNEARISERRRQKIEVVNSAGTGQHRVAPGSDGPKPRHEEITR